MPASLIFDGSFTPGWVNGERRETVEGDLQGAYRVMSWLGHYSERPVTLLGKKSDDQTQ